jgi:hypothetical protein
MPLWDWYHALSRDLKKVGMDHQLSSFGRLTSAVVAQRSAEASALAPDAQACAKSLAHPWLQVMVGHWELRNRLANLGEGEAALRDTIELFERAHRPETADCPQSICVTQDVAHCYANLDGAGYAAERLAVCEETLARIDGRWHCYQCISIQRAHALCDQGRLPAGIEALQEALRAAAYSNHPPHGTWLSLVALLLESGDPAAAQQQLDATAAQFRHQPAQYTMPRAILEAWALAEAGALDAARERLPTLDRVVNGDLALWLKAARRVLGADASRNTAELGSALAQRLATLAQAGAHGTVVELAMAAADLAVQRGAREVASALLDRAERQTRHLRRPELAAAAIEAARTSALALPVPTVGDLDALLAELEGEGDAAPGVEVALDAVEQALRVHGAEAALLGHAATLWAACGQLDRAIDRQSASVDAEVSGARVDDLISLLLRARRESEIEALANRLETVRPTLALWCRARLAWSRRAPEDTVALLTALIEQSPRVFAARQLLMKAEARCGRFDKAAAQAQWLAEQDPEDQDCRWDLLTYACAARDWNQARTVAASLGMTLSGESGPIVESWGWIRIRFPAEDVELIAERTGPVTARILQPSAAEALQHCGDLVVFDATPLHPDPEEPEARERFLRTYAHVHTLDVGGYGPTWLLDGVDPGEAAIRGFREALTARGGRWWVFSGAGYRLEDAETGDADLPGLYSGVVASADTSASDIDSLISELTADFVHPWAWPALARAAGRDVEPHLERISRYGM